MRSGRIARRLEIAEQYTPERPHDVGVDRGGVYPVAEVEDDRGRERADTG